ncbi:MAG: hypothetical protein EA364_14695 [Balneolaceae bacterium]|nr:MAG: hypothetical protein EA364_14695 [Balneolaceae bacterium]
MKPLFLFRLKDNENWGKQKAKSWSKRQKAKGKSGVGSALPTAIDSSRSSATPFDYALRLRSAALRTALRPCSGLLKVDCVEVCKTDDMAY